MKVKTVTVLSWPPGLHCSWSLSRYRFVTRSERPVDKVHLPWKKGIVRKDADHIQRLNNE